MLLDVAHPLRLGLKNSGQDTTIRGLRESLEVITSLWTRERTTLDGRYYHFNDAIGNPKPIQKPHPPIWIGAGGPQMMEVVVRYADVWNCAGASTPQEAAEKSRMLDKTCEEAGRDPATIRRSVQQSCDGRDRGQLLDLVGPSLERGFTEQMLYLAGRDQH